MGNGYGDIMKVKTSGASKKTSTANGLSYSGVKASNEMAKEDSSRMEKYMSKIKTVAKEKNIDPALIAAIISRESRAGNGLKDGWGDYDTSRGEYNAWGLMQVDVNPNGGGHTAKGGWNSLTHLRQATDILVDFIKVFRNECDKWSAEEQLKGGIAAYNIGDGKVDKKDPDNVDKETTGGDYSNDVVARAQWYRNNSGSWCNIF